MPGFLKSLERIIATSESSEKDYVVSELQLWLESLIPAEY